MSLRVPGLLLAVSLLAACATDSTPQDCSLVAVGELPVTMAGTRPLVSGTIGGEPARFLADSGSFFSILTPQRAERHGLALRPLPPTVRVVGIGGRARMQLTTVSDLSLTGFVGGRTLPDADFLVGGPGFGDEIDGLIGQNILATGDAEYDLANGFIRLFRAKGCRGPQLAYWAGPDTQIAELSFRKQTPQQPHIIASARLNGKSIRVLFDTGAERSTLSLRAAARAGITPDDEGVSVAGLSRGVGDRAVETYVAYFDTLDLGGEVIKNARLRITDLGPGLGDLLLGADFFLSHRVYVDANARKLYFTYNGGPVFELSPGDAVAAAPDVAGSPAGSPAARALRDVAASLRRRGVATAARGNYPAALAELDRAIALDPEEFEGYYERARLYAQMRQPAPALADLDRALAIESDSVRALLLRGTLRLRTGEEALAREDFDAAERVEPESPQVLLEVARAFGAAGRGLEAVSRLDAWLGRFGDQTRAPDVLLARCQLRAVANLEPRLALADCDAALDRGGRTSVAYESRALVHLRLGDYGAAIEDYDAALELQPRDATCRYGRGLAALRQGRREEGRADLDAARAIDARVGERFAEMGLEP